MTLTRDEVVAVLGPIDDTLVAEVIATGATQAQLAEAFAWSHSDEALLGEGRHLPTGPMAELIDLMAWNQDDEIG